MAQQGRPMLMGGTIMDSRYLGNFFILDREHPDPRLRAVAAAVLEKGGGFTRKAQADLPRFIVLGVEMRDPSPEQGRATAWTERAGDDELREVHRAIYEVLALELKSIFPAAAAQIRAHLAALGHGNHRPLDVALEEAAERQEQKPEAGIQEPVETTAKTPTASSRPDNPVRREGRRTGLSDPPMPAPEDDPEFWKKGPQDVRDAPGASAAELEMGARDVELKAEKRPWRPLKSRLVKLGARREREP